MKSIASITALVIFFLACNQPSDPTPASGDPGVTDPISVETMEKDGIVLTRMVGSPAYADAKLSMGAPQGYADENQVAFSFQVEDYELGVQTGDAEFRGIANSGKGQHIHLILNNSPYSAHYEPDFTKDMEDGHYVILAFLSRSYHESVKNANSFVVGEVKVGEIVDTFDIDLGEPQLFYSRPKGTYKGEDTKRLLLDFFLHNVDLSKDGYKVNVEINGVAFTLTEWAPYVIEGLPMGEATIKLELVDADGNSVDSPFNPVERKVILEAAEVEADDAESV